MNSYKKTAEQTRERKLTFCPQIAPGQARRLTVAPGQARRLTFLWGLLIAVVTNAHPLSAQTDETLLDASLGNRAVATILEMPRETPSEVLSAVFILLDLGEQPAAAKLLEPLLKERLTETQQAEFVEEFGTAKFLRLIRLDQKHTKDAAGFSGARKFAQACLKAAADKAHDPERIAKLIAKLIAQLNDAKPELRNAARVDLQATGINGVRACIETLAKVDRDLTNDNKDRRARLMAALVALHPTVDEPLLATLAGCDGVEGYLCRDLAEVAGHLRLPAAVPLLAKLAACSTDSEAAAVAQQALAGMGISKPTPAEARALAVQEIERLEAGVSAVRTAGSGKATWWRWDRQTGQLTSQTHSLATIQTLAAARLARILATCGQPDLKQRQLALIWALELRAVETAGTALPLVPTYGETGDRFDSYSPDELSDTLAEAVRRHRIAAAIACAEQLGQRKDRAALKSHQGRPSPLAKLLQHADAGLRFAALEAIMQLSAERSFAGSSHLADLLWDFAVGSGTAQAVVVSPIASRVSTWAGQLRAMGYDAIPAATGREALQSVLDSTRLALVIVDADVNRPAVREVVYQLRSIPQAGRTPVAVVCGGEQLSQFERLAEQDRTLLAAVRPASNARLAQIAGQLKLLSDMPLATEEVRLQRAKQALGWLAELLQAETAHRELRRRGQLAAQTVYQPELAETSLRVLTHLGTAGSQLALLNYVGGQTLPIENRRAAAKAFANSVHVYGKLLTASQILEQYDRYNASREADRDTQQVLGQLLDVLESEDARRAIR